MKSADVLLKMTTILKKMRTAQLRSKNKRTFKVRFSTVRGEPSSEQIQIQDEYTI